MDDPAILNQISPPTPEEALIDATDTVSQETIRVVKGRHMPAIDAARDDVQASWQIYFGVEDEIPFTLANRAYTLGQQDLNQLENLALARARVEHRASNLKADTFSAGWDLSRIQRDIYTQRLNYELIAPNMEVETELQMPFLIPMPGRYDIAILGRAGAGCVTAVFATNLYHISGGSQPSDKEASKLFDDVNDVMPKYAGGDETIRYDLLRSLSVLERIGREEHPKIRILTTIGMDLGEIDKRILSKLSKSPGSKFILNAMIQSDDWQAPNANHCVIVAGCDGKFVTVLDPKYPEGPIKLPVKEFWNRWIHTNLQAVLAITQER